MIDEEVANKTIFKALVIVESADLQKTSEKIKEALGDECALVEFEEAYVSWKQAALEEIKSGY